MDKKQRFMDAVAAKVGKRAPVMKRKGKPGMAVMIAIGAPKGGPMMEKEDGEEYGKDKMHTMPNGKKMSKAEHIAMLQEKIASLKAELALLEDEEEMDEDESEMDDEEYEDEDED